MLFNRLCCNSVVHLLPQNLREMKSLKGDKRFYGVNRYRVRYRLHNFVDTDVQSMLFPLNLMQNILLCPKYRIKNNFIHPNNLTSIVLTLCGGALSISLMCYRIYVYFTFDVVKIYWKLLSISSYADLLLYCFGFIVNYVANVRQTKRNMAFVLKIQDVHRFLNEKSYSKRFIIGNWFNFILIWGFYIYISIHIVCHFHLSVLVLFICLTFMCFDINVVYATRILKLLSDKVHIWNIYTQRLVQMDHRDKEVYCKRMFQTYVDILESYKIYRSSFQQMVGISVLFVVYENK